MASPTLPLSFLPLLDLLQGFSIGSDSACEVNRPSASGRCGACWSPFVVVWLRVDSRIACHFVSVHVALGLGRWAIIGPESKVGVDGEADGVDNSQPRSVRVGGAYLVLSKTTLHFIRNPEGS